MDKSRLKGNAVDEFEVPLNQHSQDSEGNTPDNTHHSPRRAVVDHNRDENANESKQKQNAADGSSAPNICAENPISLIFRQFRQVGLVGRAEF
jgi:hypothetical protein